MAMGRSRRRSRNRRPRRGSSWSQSASRRRRSKWSLKKYTVAGKDVKKLNCYDLIHATMMWALEINELSVGDCRAIFEQISFLANRDMHNDFLDAVHVEFDKAIRRFAETFSRAHGGVSAMYYGTQYMHTKRQNSYQHPSASAMRGMVTMAARGLTMSAKTYKHSKCTKE